MITVGIEEVTLLTAAMARAFLMSSRCVFLPDRCWSHVCLAPNLPDIDPGRPTIHAPDATLSFVVSSVKPSTHTRG